MSDIPPIVWKMVRQFPRLLATKFRERLFGSANDEELEELKRLEKQARNRRPEGGR